MKECKYCNKYFPETDFGVAKTTINKVYRRRKCCFCYRKTKNALKIRRRGWIDEYKAERGCLICGNLDSRVLDFHHKNGDEKEFVIADFYYHQYSMEKVEAEIRKCDVMCANCHRILHFENRKNGL